MYSYICLQMMKVKMMLTQTWFFIMLCLFFLVKPITGLWKKTSEDDVDSSRINHSDVNITTEFSDGELMNFVYCICDLFY